MYKGKPEVMVFDTYMLLKFLHVTAAIVWVGGVFAVAVINARLTREQDSVASALAGRQGVFFGTRVMLPSAVVTFITGMGMVGVSGTGLSFWTSWGMAGVFGSIALGATVLRRAGQEMAALTHAGNPDGARVATLRRRLAVGGALNLLLLFSTVAVMVFKPTL
jgi:uncharacterized membrane protein